MVSNILNACGIDHVPYHMSQLFGYSCCCCDCITTDDLSILDTADYLSYLCRADYNLSEDEAKQYIIDNNREKYSEMVIADYLIYNQDRHMGNWGFFYDANIMNILGLHPLFDHNRAFIDAEAYGLDGGFAQFEDNRSMREASLAALEYCDIHVPHDLPSNMFPSVADRELFYAKVKELGL